MTDNKRDLEEWHALNTMLALAGLMVDQARHQLERAEQMKRLLESHMIDIEKRLKIDYTTQNGL